MSEADSGGWRKVTPWMKMHIARSKATVLAKPTLPNAYYIWQVNFNLGKMHLQ